MSDSTSHEKPAVAPHPQTIGERARAEVSAMLKESLDKNNELNQGKLQALIIGRTKKLAAIPEEKDLFEKIGVNVYSPQIIDFYFKAVDEVLGHTPRDKWAQGPKTGKQVQGLESPSNHGITCKINDISAANNTCDIKPLPTPSGRASSAIGTFKR